MDLPTSLKPIKAYLEQGKLRSGDPLVAYYCNLYALQEAMALRSKIPKADMAFIISLMDQVEAQKKTLGELDDSSSALVENAALEIFQKADDADRMGNHGLQVAKDFMAAATLLEVGKQFGELPDDVKEKIKYSKWRFVELCKAAKERRPPAPPRGTQLDSSGGDGDGAGGQAEPPMPSLTEGISPMPPTADSLPPTAPHVAAPAAPPYVTPSQEHAPPSYLDLPPAVPPSAFTAPPNVGHMPQQTSFGAPSVPQQLPYDAPPAHPPMAHNAPVYAAHPSYRPPTTVMLEAARLCQSAATNLQFQDHTTAIATLQQALQLLTQPSAPTAAP